MLTKERVIDILVGYVDFDLDGADSSYVKDVLTNVCGCTDKEIFELGFDYLWPDKNDWFDDGN